MCLGHKITGAHRPQRLRGHTLAHASVQGGDAADLGRGQEKRQRSADAGTRRRPPCRPTPQRLLQGLPRLGRHVRPLERPKTVGEAGSSWCSRELQRSRSHTSTRTTTSGAAMVETGVCPKTVRGTALNSSRRSAIRMADRSPADACQVDATTPTVKQRADMLVTTTLDKTGRLVQ